ncbi:hypothetical protein [Streptomyces anandii]|uniref:hypothetical protein n=1 Tax=Streptomyces anandii TaxID=285454 RepID=UPI003797637A
MRGTGGVRIAGQDCSTDVPGLYAAGDTATRELICGGFTGGGSHNAAWAASSGSWAGRGAATFASGRGRPGRAVRPVGTAGLRPTGAVNVGHREVVTAVQREVLPYDRNYLRHADRLEPALRSLHETWAAVREGLGASGEALFRAREAAAVVTAVAPGSRFRDATELKDSGLLGGYRRELGWGRGRTLGARTAVGPE